MAIRPFDPSQPDDAPERLAHLPEIDSCYSVAGEDFYLLLVRVASPADLERLLQEIRTAANVTTRTTVGAVDAVREPLAEDQCRAPASGALAGAGEPAGSSAG